MADDQRSDEPARPPGGLRAARMAVVFVVVVVVAALLGRIGSGIDDGPARLDESHSQTEAAAVAVG